MRHILFALCLGAALIGAATFASTPGQSRIIPALRMAGRDYELMSDWARANGFSQRWLGRDAGLQLTNRNARMMFAVDSHDLRMCEINGISVVLSFPLVMKDGLVFIASTDLRTAVQPLLHPQLNHGSDRVRTIVIDPGHGGRDAGAMDGSHQEKTYALLLAQELRDQLNKAGFKATLTRTTDVYVERPVRPDIARRRGADLFISVHWNTTETGKNEVKGAQTYCLTPTGAPSSNAGGEGGGGGSSRGNRNDSQNAFLAFSIQRALVRNMRVDDLGVRHARFEILRIAEMPSVLVEGGYMSNPAEARKIYDPAYRRQMASAIVAGIQYYKSHVEPQAAPHQ